MSVALLISNKIDVKLKSVKRDKEGNFIIVTGKIHQDEISILKVYGPNTRAPSYVKETLLKVKSYIKSHTLIVGDFTSTLSPLDNSFKQKMYREISEPTKVMTQMDLTEIYRIFHVNNKEYTFFSAPYGAFSKIDHILSNRTNLNKYRKIGITQCTLSDDYG